MVDTKLSPVAFNVPIADPDTGFPTSYFERLFQILLKEKAASEEAAITIANLGGDPNEDSLIMWDDSAGLFVFITTSEALDLLGSAAHGDILYRDSGGWALLAAGTDGDVLTTHAAGADPTWETPTAPDAAVTLYRYASLVPHAGANTITGIGASNTNIGTNAAATIAATNYLTQQPRIQYTSATTANAQAGFSMGTTPQCVHSTVAGESGAEFFARWGASQLPTGPRLFIGLTAGTFIGNTGEPSAFTQNYAVFAKDSTDTNIQFLVNSNVSTGTKTDTGIALVANAFYETRIWFEAGGGTMFAEITRLDTGTTFSTSTSTDIPVNGALLFPQLIGSLNSTNTGTAIIMHPSIMTIKVG